MEKMRLDRFLSGETDLTRNEVKKRIRQGQVSVNGEKDVRPEQKIDPDTDAVCLAGTYVRPSGMIYLLLNKPAGVLSATEDRRARTVLDLIDRPRGKKLFPAGRLDKDTEGLLLLTNDGMLAHSLLSPGKHVYKVYIAVADGEVTEEDEKAFEKGMDIGEEKKTLPAYMRRLAVDGDALPGMKNIPDREVFGDVLPRLTDSCLSLLTLQDYARCGEGQSLCMVALREGRFHQIKRMFEKRGRRVVFLKRIAMGPLLLDRNLLPGQYRSLTDEELKELKKDPAEESF